MSQQQMHSMTEVLEFCRENSMPARVVGRWVWLKFPGKPKQAILDAIKSFGFRWSPRRKQWSHNCGVASQPARTYAPWDRYATRTLEETLSANR